MDLTQLWIPATLAAAAAQTARNATQRTLTETLGTVGATQVRFLYGFPFSLIFLAGVITVTGEQLPLPGASFAGYLILGAMAQILATALMLAAMRERSFSVVTALIKTEPVQTAVLGLVLLGDVLTLPLLAAIVVATVGVVLMSMNPAAVAAKASLRPVALGIGAGALFALSATGFRGAILELPSGSFLVRATTTLAWSLGVQTLVLILWLAVFDRAALWGSLRAWRPSLGAGFLGALASQFWFIGFSLTSAANVRTLALVEVLMAQAVSHRLFRQETSARELLGIGLIVIGVVLLLAAQS
ncbi:DMT family transporter [Microvirga massiliensis]|uniref:DMT family transporter n=1 Tax=Microvirga massiliensis TaxID=1033741 RepID=UPI00062B6577|nr:DMT family transporter [Microvirga massiliensis]